MQLIIFFSLLFNVMWVKIWCESSFHAFQTDESPNSQTLYHLSQIMNLDGLYIAEYVSTKATTGGLGKEPAPKRSSALQNA